MIVGFGARFGLAALAGAWRATHLLAEEDGPADAVVRLRSRLGSSALGDLMDCFYCLSAWVALPFTPAVARRAREALLVWPALSGAACLLERVTAREGRELRPASSAGDGAGRVEPARSG